MELAGINVTNSKFIDFFDKNPSVKNYLTQNTTEKSYVFKDKYSTVFVLSSSSRPLFSKIVYQVNYFFKKEYGKVFPADELANIVAAYLLAYMMDDQGRDFNETNYRHYLRQAQDIGGLTPGFNFTKAKDYLQDSIPFAGNSEPSKVYLTIIRNAGDPIISKFFNVRYKLGENPNITVDPVLTQPQRKDSDEREKDKSIYYLLGAAGIIGGIIYLKNRKGKKGKRRK